MKTQLVASLLIVAASAASLNLNDDIEIRDCGIVFNIYSISELLNKLDFRKQSNNHKN